MYNVDVDVGKCNESLVIYFIYEISGLVNVQFQIWAFNVFHVTMSEMFGASFD